MELLSRVGVAIALAAVVGGCAVPRPPDSPEPPTLNTIGSGSGGFEIPEVCIPLMDPDTMTMTDTCHENGPSLQRG